jgi:hypothetical protein
LETLVCRSANIRLCSEAVGDSISRAMTCRQAIRVRPVYVGQSRASYYEAGQTTTVTGSTQENEITKECETDTSSGKCSLKWYSNREATQLFPKPYTIHHEVYLSHQCLTMPTAVPIQSYPIRLNFRAVDFEPSAG